MKRLKGLFHSYFSNLAMLNPSTSSHGWYIFYLYEGRLRRHDRLLSNPNSTLLVYVQMYMDLNRLQQIPSLQSLCEDQVEN